METARAVPWAQALAGAIFEIDLFYSSTMMRRHSMLSPKRTPKGPKFDDKLCENNSVLSMFDTFLDNFELRLAKLVRQKNNIELML